MGTKFVNVDRETGMLLPPDVRDWVADNDLAHFVLEAVEATDVSVARVNVRGTGDAQYPPAMMLGLLIYCYATGTFSSRAMQRASFDSLAVRFLCANLHPDHDTIAKFRRENGPLIKSCFVEVLQLAREVGLLKLGTLSVDGTKLAARSGKKRALHRGELEAELRQVEGEVETLLARAEAADRENVDDGTSLPRELANRQRRGAQLREAKRVLDERQQDRRRPGSSNDSVHPNEPESTLMKTAQGPFVQGYNAQAAVTTEGPTLIVAPHVVTDGNDRRQLVAAIEAIPPQLPKPDLVLADTGYDTQQQIDQLESQGIRVYCPPQNVAENPPEKSRGDDREHVWQQRQARQKQLEQPEVKKKYGRRAATSEPCFHLIKCLMGFARFSLRGLKKVNLEWDLVALAYNCRKLAPLWA
jgi:transposase